MPRCGVRSMDVGNASDPQLGWFGCHGPCGSRRSHAERPVFAGDRRGQHTRIALAAVTFPMIHLLLNRWSQENQTDDLLKCTVNLSIIAGIVVIFRARARRRRTNGLRAICRGGHAPSEAASHLHCCTFYDARCAAGRIGDLNPLGRFLAPIVRWCEPDDGASASGPDPNGTAR